MVRGDDCEVWINELKAERDEWKQAAAAEADLLDEANRKIRALQAKLEAANNAVVCIGHNHYHVKLVPAPCGCPPNHKE